MIHVSRGMLPFLFFSAGDRSNALETEPQNSSIRRRFPHPLPPGEGAAFGNFYRRSRIKVVAHFLNHGKYRSPVARDSVP